MTSTRTSPGMATGLSRCCLGVALCLASVVTQAQAPATPTPASGAAQAGKVVVSGVVPDEPTRRAIVNRAREVFGADRVVDQVGIDRLATPPNWIGQVQKVITPELKKVSSGQLRITGNVVDLSGQVDADATRDQLSSHLTTQLANPTYTVRNHLQAVGSGQQALNDALARRTIEFEPGNARLTASGMAVLDQLLPVLKQMQGRRFEVIGHTDDSGRREANLALSAARAATVKAYLTDKGIAAADIVTSGAGPDRPVTSNQTPEGRAKNRRIEFRVMA